MSEQDYIPGTQVIRNLVRRDGKGSPYGTTDQRVLDEAENFYIPTRLAELHNGQAKPDHGVKPFSFGHMRQIHQHLFQDVYAWAGEPRRVPMTKHVTSYAEPAEMNALLRRQYAGLAEQNYLQGISGRQEFTSKLAGFWAEINHAHAFREGNTRSQTVFFEQLARHAGWHLDVSRLSPHHPRSVYPDFVAARFEHQRLRSSALPGSSADALNAPEAARELTSVLYALIEPDSSPEGHLRRGGAVPGVVADQMKGPATDSLAVSPKDQGPDPIRIAAPRNRHSWHPELLGMTLDRYGLDADKADRAGEAYQP